ncbi:MAG: helix-turn-helix domain-containing protein [Promethearchaeota archaeon]
MEIINKQLARLNGLKAGNNDDKSSSSIKCSQEHELFKCILGLNPLETEIFCYILRHDHVSTLELERQLGKDRSTIQKTLKTLLSLDLIKRTRISLKKFNTIKKMQHAGGKRGYLYVYDIMDLPIIKNRLRDLLDEFYQTMLNHVNRLEELINNNKKIKSTRSLRE